MPHLIVLLLPFAAGMGWYWGRKEVNDNNNRHRKQFSREYFNGLNYLLNEEPDKAVDIFIKMLEVDGDTVETHLALGSLFRRRGEVDRAIRIHQNLIARPHLNKADRVQALLELGQDYLYAGVLDRAERLFLEVIEMGEQIVPSMQHLLDIYQQEKDWEKAIKVAQQLERVDNRNMKSVIAHFHCEIAQYYHMQNDFEQAHRSIKRALAIDRNCVRASLLQGQLEVAVGRYKAAINSYKRIKTQDHEYLSEAISPLVYCYEKMNDEAGMIDYLRQCLDEYPRITIVLIFTERLKQWHNGDNQEASEFLAEQLRRRPSIRGIKRLFELHMEAVEGAAKENMTILHDLVTQLSKDKPNYRCQHCGFAIKTLQWQCPSCRYWNTVKPIHGLEGD